MANDGEVSALHKRRSTIKDSCARIKSYVDSAHLFTPTVIAQLEERKNKIERHWIEYDEVQTRLEAQNENESADRTHFEEAFYEVSARMREMLSRVNSSQIASPSPSASSAADNLVYIRLPKLNLPTFTGKYEE